jgi:hypothetical protein
MESRNVLWIANVRSIHIRTNSADRERMRHAHHRALHAWGNVTCCECRTEIKYADLGGLQAVPRERGVEWIRRRMQRALIPNEENA